MRAMFGNFIATWDLALLLFFIAAGFFWGISRGSGRLKLVALALYIELVLFPLIHVSKFGSLDARISADSTALGIFVILFLLLLFLLQKPLRSIRSSNAWWKILLASVVIAGFFMYALLHALPSFSTIPLNPLLHTIFVASSFSFLWLLAPLLTLVFF